MSPPLLDRLHADLRAARLARDAAAAAALRSVVTAAENAAAVQVEPSPVGEPAFVADVPRQALDDDAVWAVVRAEADDLEQSERLYRELGQADEADGLAAQREVLARYLA